MAHGEKCNYGFLIYKEWFEENYNNADNTNIYKTFEDYVDGLSALGYGISISPCHNKDTYEKDDPDGRYNKGDIKKAHYHCLLYNSKRHSIDSLLRKLVPFGIKFLKPMYSDEQSFEYLTHDSKNSKDKVHYSKDDIINLNGGAHMTDDVDKTDDVDLAALISFADENQIYSFDDFVYLWLKETGEFISGKTYYYHTTFLKAYLSSPRRRFDLSNRC